MKVMLSLLWLLFLNGAYAQDTTILPRDEREEILESQRADDPQIVEEAPEIQREEEAPPAETRNYLNEFNNPVFDNGNGTTTNRRHEWPEP